MMKTKRWGLDLQLFNDPAPNPTPVPGGDPTPNGGGGKGDPAPNPAPAPAAPAVSFSTKQEFEAAQQSAVNEYLKSLGIEKPDDLKGILDDHKKRADAEKTAEQKLTERDGELQAANTTIRSLRVENAFVLEAFKQNVDPEKLPDALRLADLSKVEVTDGGKIKGIDAFVKDLIEAKPWLLKTEQSPSGHTPGAKHPGGGGASTKTMSALINGAQRRR